MTQLQDFYKTVYELRDNLKAAGQIAWSTSVDDALYGSTSGEILGDLGVKGRETAHVV